MSYNILYYKYGEVFEQASWESDVMTAAALWTSCSDAKEEKPQSMTPGLRHIYRKYLKKKPEFDGMVILNLKIAASGAVENVDVKSSTTDYPEFDAEIVKAVSSWMFPKSKAGGNVTIPFTFYVNE